jgi:glycyl-tRNA synthetase beta chain
MAAFLAQQLAPDLTELVRRAAYLSKADIVTEMVGEFPSLQGMMGRQYAKLSGEPPAVAEAIFTHYLPRHAGDLLPGDLTGALVGMGDRFDTICGCFGVGLIPTGAADPYGLRRHALAIIHILRDQGLHLNLPEAVWAALDLLKGKISRTPEETALEVLDFFQTRLQHLLLSEGIDNETVAAVLAAGGAADVVDAADKAKALEEVRRSPDFPALAVAFKRVINIARGAEAGEVTDLLFEHPEEKYLYEATGLMETEVAAAMEKRDYPAVCRALAQLKNPVDAFFDKVLVMAENENLKRNRLSLLVRISDTFLQMADFSRITTG